MNSKSAVMLLALCCLPLTGVTLAAPGQWIPLFNGEDLSGWRPTEENRDSFRVEDGAIVCRGARSHLFYSGSVQGADFKNFELKVDVMTEPGANGGIYFHSAYQDSGWPARGFEAQVNNSYVKDWRKTGSLYNIQDVNVPLAQDNVWYTEHIIVRGDRVVIKIDGRTVVDWTQASDHAAPDRTPGRALSRGTFALQGHDPKSVVHYKNIKVKPLPDDVPSVTAPSGWVSLFDGKTLDGWEQKNGTAAYKVVGGTIKGTTAPGSPNSFLCSDPYRDFEFEFEVKVDPRLNSGVQIRSNSMAEYQNGRVHGYQVEIATGGNAGFIYDEARRGWLSTDRTCPHARAAFKQDNWNHFRVVCVGDTIRTWVNGVPVAEVVDNMTRVGFLGLQVHSFRNDPAAWVLWRNLKIKELEPTDPQPLKVVVVTGGHEFEEPFFRAMFEEMSSVRFTEAKQKDHSEVFENIDNWDYDVIVLYNMTQKISKKRRSNLTKLMDRGIGMVAMHHTLAAYQEWPEFFRIIGGRYYLKNDEGQKQSTYEHDLDLLIEVADANHPVNQGQVEFIIHDEAYKGMWHAKDNVVLLTSDHESSDKPIAWTRVYHGARVCTIQLGHDHLAYENPHFRRLVTQAIQWVSQK